jgi:thymidylate synthase
MRNTSAENQYAENIFEIKQNGNISKDRTGVGTKRIQSTVIHSNLQDEFPILVGKKINFQSAFVEMVWMLSGRIDVEWLRKNGVNYWNDWEDTDGNIGKGYGWQFRNFGGDENGKGGVDQLNFVVNELKKNPDSRRALISLWNPNQLQETTLPPCHFLYHFLSYISDKDGKRYLDLHVTQRSADYFLGVPYNLVMSGIFVTLMAKHLGMQVGSIHQTFNDSHTYLNHSEQVIKYLNNVYHESEERIFSRSHNNDVVNIKTREIPKLVMTDEFANLVFEDFEEMLQYIAIDFSNKETSMSIVNYKSYPFIKADVAV